MLTAFHSDGLDVITKHWQALKKAVFTAKKILRPSQHETSDWFWGNREEMQRLLDKTQCLPQWHLQDSEKSRVTFAEIKSQIQRKVRLLNKDWWCRRKLCRALANKHNYLRLFIGLKASFGPSSNGVVSFKSAEQSKLHLEEIELDGRNLSATCSISKDLSNT